MLFEETKVYNLLLISSAQMAGRLSVRLGFFSFQDSVRIVFIVILWKLKLLTKLKKIIV